MVLNQSFLSLEKKIPLKILWCLKFLVTHHKNSFKIFLFKGQSIYCGKTIEIEPEISLLEKKCLNCKAKNFDDGLETPVECVICKNIYIAKDHEIIKYNKNI